MLRVMLRVVWRLVVLVRVVHFRKVRRMHGWKKRRERRASEVRRWSDVRRNGQTGRIVRWLFEGDVRVLRIPHIRGDWGPVPIARRGGGEGWSRWALGLSTIREHQDLWLLVRIARTGTRMPLDHPLGCEERLDLFAQERNAVGLLDDSMRIANGGRHRDTLTLIHSGRLAPKPRH